MIRALVLTALTCVICLAVFVLARLAATAGLMSDDTVTLWAGAIAAGDQEMSIGRILAAYPTLPFLSTALLQFLTPRGAPTPVLLTMALLSLITGAWFLAFRRAGLPLAVAAAVALLLALNPLMLRAAIAGPSDMMLALFLGLLTNALFDMRARSGASEVMSVALSLLGLAFSHPMGAALACTAAPLIIFAVRPELLSGAVVNLVIAIIFPTVFCVGAFSYVSWVFPGSGWSFLTTPAEGLANWSADFSKLFGNGISGSLALDASVGVAIALCLGAPLVPVAIGWVRRRRPLVAPPLVIIAMTISAAWLTVATSLFGEPAALAVMPPILAAVMIRRTPEMREKLAIVAPLLVVGWFGGIAGLAVMDPRGATNLIVAMRGGGVDADRLAALSLGAATVGREGVLVDTFNAPAVVLGRGQAQGLLSPSDDTFSIGVLFAKIDAPFVAVPDPHTGVGAQDRLNRAFPLLYRNGAPGYRLIYEKANWRLFGRM
jgi:hypothetical protein